MNDSQLDRRVADASPYLDSEVRAFELNRADSDLFAEIVDASRALRVEDELRLEAISRGRRSMSGRIATVAATVAIVLAGLAVWQTSRGSQTPSAAPTTVTTTTASVSPTDLSWPPRILLDDSWTVVYADEETTAIRGDVQFVRSGDQVEVTWRPDVANLDSYQDSESMTVERGAHVLGHEAVIVRYLGADPPPGVPAPTIPLGTSYRAVIPVEAGTIEIALELQRADVLEPTLASLRWADTATWEAALPARTVTPAERPEAVGQILNDIPLPPEMGLEEIHAALFQPIYSDRYQLVAYVTGAVLCGWLDVWFTTVDADDAEGAQAAADGLATSRDWDALKEILGEGGWPEYVWAYADAINGDTPEIEVGPGGVPTRLSAANSGCNRFWIGASLPPEASLP